MLKQTRTRTGHSYGSAFSPKVYSENLPEVAGLAEGKLLTGSTALLLGIGGALVELWHKDKEKTIADRAGRERQRREELVQAERERKQLEVQRREVLSLLQSGMVSKAMNRVTSHGVADCRDQGNQQQVKRKFPAREVPLPDQVSRHKAIDSFRDLRGSLLSLDAGISPGSGGIKNEYLVALGERMEDEGIKLLEQFGMAYIAGELPAWMYLVWLSIQTITKPMAQTSGLSHQETTLPPLAYMERKRQA